MFSTFGRLEMFKDEETRVPFHVVKYLDQYLGNVQNSDVPSCPDDPKGGCCVFLGRSSTKVTQPWVNTTNYGL